MGEPAELVLYTIGLLSKWGFNDGDMPDEFADWLDDEHPEIGYVEWRPVLVRLVRAYVLPALAQAVEVEELETNHNPIRATRVDGVDIDRHGEPHMALEPQYVAIPFRVVLQHLSHS